jgi:hypothetical protein
MDKATYDRSLSFWTMAFYYLKLVHVSLEQSLQQGNRWSVTASSPIELDDYDEQTKWSDFNIIVPVLFDFYHGLELLLKGFVLLRQPESPQLDHRIEELLAKFQCSYPDQVQLTCIFAKYIKDKTSVEVLRDFFDSNKCSTNKFYEVLRYPSDKNLASQFSHHCLKYRQAGSLPFFKDLIGDIHSICGHAVQLGRSFKPTA